MAPPFLYALAVKVWQGQTSGANLTLDTRFLGHLSTQRRPPGSGMSGFGSCPIGTRVTVYASFSGSCGSSAILRSDGSVSGFSDAGSPAAEETSPLKVSPGTSPPSTGSGKNIASN